MKTRMRSPRRKAKSNPKQEALILECEDKLVEYRILRDGIANYIARAYEPEEVLNAVFVNEFHRFLAIATQAKELEERRYAGWIRPRKNPQRNPVITPKGGI